MSRWRHISAASPMAFAFIASAALHLGAMYGASRIITASRSASLPSVEFRAGDHAIEVQLISPPLLVPIEAELAVVDAPAEEPTIKALVKPRESEQAEVDLERDIPVSALQDAAVAQAAAEETRRRIAHIVVAQAQKAVGRLKELLESAAAPVDTAEPVVPVQIVEQRVEVPRPKPEKASTPKIVPPAIVTSSKAETTPAPKPKTEPVPAGRSGVTHGASLLDLPTPHYPLASRRRGEEGLITLRVDVHADGSVGEVEIVSGARFKRLRQAAIEAIRRARFAPAKRDGKAIVSVVIVPIRFTLR